MRTLFKNLLIITLLLMSGQAFSQETQNQPESSFLLTMGTEVPGSFFKVEQFDGKISKFLNTNKNVTEKEVIIVAPAAQGGMVPPSVERKIRELKAQAKKEGKEIEPRVILISKEYLQNVDDMLQKYNKAIESSLDPNKNIDVFKDDPKAKELYEKGDKLGLLSHLSEAGKLDNMEQAEEIKAATNVLSSLKEKLQKTILNPDPKVRKTTLITLPIKAALQGFSCYFAVYIAGGIPADRVIPYIAFNMTMTVLINSFISDFIRWRSATESIFTDAHDKGLNYFLNRAKTWKTFVDKRIEQQKPWLLDATFSRLLENGLPKTLMATTRVSKFFIRGDFTFQYFVSFFFLVSSITITDSWMMTDHSALTFVNGIRKFMELTPDANLSALSITAFVLGVNLWNCLSGVPIDLVNSYLNRVGSFKNTSSIWLSFIPEVLYQKDKLAQVGLSGLNNGLNWIVTIISLPVYAVAHYIYPATKDKQKLTDDEIKQTGLDQSILNAKLYPEETKMRGFLGKELPDGIDQLIPKEYREKLIEACIAKIERDLKNGISLNRLVSEDPAFFASTFINILIEKAGVNVSIQEQKVYLEMATSLLDELKGSEYKKEVKKLKSLITGINDRIKAVKSDLLRENLEEYVRSTATGKVSGIGDESTDDVITLIAMYPFLFNFDSAKGRKAFFGTEAQEGTDGILYYLQDKIRTTTDQSKKYGYNIYLLALCDLALTKIDDVRALGVVGDVFINNMPSAKTFDLELKEDLNKELRSLLEEV